MLVLGLVDVPLWFLLIVASVILLYLYGTRKYGHFKGTGIEGPKPWPFFGNTLQVLKNMRHFDFEMKKKHGNIYGSFFGTTPVITIHDQEMISEVLVKQFSNFQNRLNMKSGEPIIDSMLVTLEDDHWKHVRSTMSPTFTTGKLRMMAKEISRCATQLAENIGSSDEPFETRESAGNYTLDVIASTAFGLRVSSQTDKNNPFVINAKKVMDRKFTNPLVILTLIFPKLRGTLAKFGVHTFDQAAMDFFLDVIRQTLANRTEGDEERNDFIQLMINAQRGEKIYSKEDEDEVEKHNTSQTKPGLTSDEVVGNAFLFFMAGFDTTATGLTQLMYSLACNPECQEKVFNEIDEEIGQKEVTYDAVMKLRYLDQCLQESLRLYPPAPSVSRMTKRDTVINGVEFKKGTLANVPVFALHLDPVDYPDPEKFDPDRFSPEEKANRNPIKWLPFGFGPRNCIAMRLALYQIKVAIVHILRHHKLVTCSKTEQPIEWDNRKWMKSKNGVWLATEKRQEIKQQQD